MLEQFKEDVDAGLSSCPKVLSSRFFYDKKGDELFQQIMAMPEYYLTNKEFEIFSKQSDKLIDAFDLKKDEYFELIELGAGDGTKTVELLKALQREGYSYDYFPIDISQNSLDGLEKMLSEKTPALKVVKKQGDYFGVLSSFKESKKKKVLLFMGSNIGNMNDDRAREFIYKLGENLNSGDKLLIGIDLMKSIEIVGPAYNDRAGITSAFNLNLLDRINRELGGDFDLEKWVHAPEYDEETGYAKSFIKSSVNQTVSISAIGKSFDFEKGEKIHTEISRKYNDTIMKNIISGTDFKLHGKLTDADGWFADYVLVRG
ncbi:MAG: L-histidine N(alpha)-methyltransferase [Flavobacteriales bacterium]